MSNQSAQPAEGAKAGVLPLPYREFIALMALLMSMTGALSIDIMLPALPDIGAALGVANPSDLPLVVSSFMLGMAAGQLRLGAARRPIRPPACAARGPHAFFVSHGRRDHRRASRCCLPRAWRRASAAPSGRIIVTAIVRDLFAGREMARVMSTVMMVFITGADPGPVGRPDDHPCRHVALDLLGAAAGGRSAGIAWAGLRLPETRAGAAPERRALHAGERASTCARQPRDAWLRHRLRVHLRPPRRLHRQRTAGVRRRPMASASCSRSLLAASPCAIALRHRSPTARLVQRIGMRRLSHTALVALLVLTSAAGAVARPRRPAAWRGARPAWRSACSSTA